MSLSLVAVFRPIRHRHNEADDQVIALVYVLHFVLVVFPDSRRVRITSRFSIVIDSFLDSGQNDLVYPVQCWRGLQNRPLFMIASVLGHLGSSYQS